MRTILTTGATGFLGGATVAALLDQGHGKDLLFLVRAESATEGLGRVRESVGRFEVPESRIDQLSSEQVVCGDLADVAAFAADPRLDRVTHVLNCAAITSFGKHPMTWPVNVDGTLAFARRMASNQDLRRFVHVGTAMACGANHAGKVVQESWDLPTSDHLVDYTASKAEAERRLRHELPSLPLVVARPSIVVGHSKLGCKPSSSIFWVFRMGISLEFFLCDLDSHIDVVPVDYCASALSTLLLSDQLKHDLYHISAGTAASCSFRSIGATISSSAGKPSFVERYRRVHASQVADLTSHCSRQMGSTNRRLTARAMMLYGAFSALGYVFDNRRLLEAGVAPPPKFVDYIDLCFASSTGQSIAEQMLQDFK